VTAGAVEGVGHAGWNEVEQLGYVLRLQQLAAKAVEHLRFETARVDLVRLLADAAGQMAGIDRGGEKGEQRDPVLGVVDGEGANRRKEVVVEQDSRGNRCANGVAQAPTAGEEQHQQKQSERYGGIVCPGKVMVESYNTEKPTRDENPARRLDYSFDGHNQNCIERWAR